MAFPNGIEELSKHVRDRGMKLGISSRVFDWNPALRQRAAENVALYKNIRGVIAAGDVYHTHSAPWL